MLNNTLKEFEIELEDLDLEALEYMGVTEEDLLKWKAEGYKICYRLSNVVLWADCDLKAIWAEHSGVLVSIEKIKGDRPGDTEDNPFH